MLREFLATATHYIEVSSLFYQVHCYLYIYLHAWAPASAGTHASGRAGQHFELFDSILGTAKKVTTHIHSLHVQYAR